MKLSIIIPTYNRAETILKQVKRFLNINIDFQLIVINDGSTDNTSELLNSIKDKRLEFIDNKHNVGVTKAVRNVLPLLKGDYIYSIADDDEMVNDDFIKNYKTYSEDIICGKYETVINSKVIPNGFRSDKEILSSDEALKIFDQFVLGGNTIFKKDLYLKVIDMEFKHDFSSLFFFLINADKIRFINDVVMRWRVEMNSSSFASTKMKSTYGLLKWDLLFLDEIIPVLEKEGRYEKYKWFIEKRIFEIFENVKFNYFFKDYEKYFEKLLNEIDNEIYIYGYGYTGVLLEDFLNKKGIRILGVVDDYKKECMNLRECDKTKQFVIATFKEREKFKMYKNLINNGINNIREIV